MLEEYDELFNNFSEAESVIEQANEELSRLLSERVKSTLDKAKEAEMTLDDLLMEISSAKAKRDMINREFEEARRKAEQAEIQELPGKYIAKYVRAQTGGFAPGDTVFTVDKETHLEQCPLCEGEKDVNAAINGEVHLIRCPKCSGLGNLYIPDYKVMQKKIESIRLQLGFSNGRVSFWEAASIALAGESFNRNIESIYLTEAAASEALKHVEAQAK